MLNLPSPIGDQAPADALMMLRSWIAHPVRTAAVLPSGAALARLMTSELDAKTGAVIELGPGTGPFTYAMIARGVTERAVTLVEFDAGFARLLQIRFPEATVLRADASRLRHVPMSGDKAGAVVSGLPILTMPARKVMAILEGAFHHLRDDGAFYQFTYMPTCPISQRILDRLDLRAVRIGRTLANVPPASVYRITRRRSRR